MVLTVENFENITLRMRLLFELQSVKCHLDGRLSRRRGPDEGAKQFGFRFVFLQERSCRMFAKKILGVLSADVGNSYARFGRGAKL